MRLHSSAVLKEVISLQPRSSPATRAGWQDGVMQIHSGFAPRHGAVAMVLHWVLALRLPATS